MSKLVFNRDGGKTDEFGHLLVTTRQTTGEVVEGLTVAANGSPNMSVNVAYGTAKVPTGSAGTAYAYHVALDGTENITITTANGSNPRNDLIVLYVDKSVTPSQSYTNNSNNVLKVVAVAGTPASTPADPNTAAIQSVIGAANPYIILARVVVGAGVTQINSGNITDLRSMVTFNSGILNKIKTFLLPYVYPVGSIYTNATDSTNPATLFGFGTWTAFAAGRVPVGVGTSDQAFSAGATGGASTHTLSGSEMPSHNHTYSWGTGGAAAGGSFTVMIPAGFNNTNNTSSVGGGGAHNNLQPYVVVYMWRRTA